jgi:CheY-like chemotaxis protein
LILLDFVMPQMNGYEVCQALQQDEMLGQVPVVLMSAKADQVGERFVKVMGIVDYITKPFSPEAITAVVQHTLRSYADRRVDQADAALLDEVSPEAAIDAADAAALAKREALERLRAGIKRATVDAVLDGVARGNGGVTRDQLESWIDEGLSIPVVDGLAGELRAAAPELAGVGEAVLTGDIGVVPLAEVLLLLQQQEQRGTLVVRRANAQVDLHFNLGNIDLAAATGLSEEFLLGRFLVEADLLTAEELELFLTTRKGSNRLLGHQLVKLGYISEANLKAAMERQTSEIIYEMLRWNFGRFTFRAASDPAPLAAEAGLAMSVEGILMEGLRRIDKWHVIEREIDSFDLVFLRNDDALARLGRGKLCREEIAVLELVNGKNTVKEIVRLIRMGSFDVSRLLYRLLAIKLIRKRVSPVAV